MAGDHVIRLSAGSISACSPPSPFFFLFPVHVYVFHSATSRRACHLFKRPGGRRPALEHGGRAICPAFQQTTSYLHRMQRAAGQGAVFPYSSENLLDDALYTGRRRSVIWTGIFSSCLPHVTAFLISRSFLRPSSIPSTIHSVRRRFSCPSMLPCPVLPPILPPALLPASPFPCHVACASFPWTTKPSSYMTPGATYHTACHFCHFSFCHFSLSFFFTSTAFHIFYHFFFRGPYLRYLLFNRHLLSSFVMVSCF